MKRLSRCATNRRGETRSGPLSVRRGPRCLPAKPSKHLSLEAGDEPPTVVAKSGVFPQRRETCQRHLAVSPDCLAGIEFVVPDDGDRRGRIAELVPHGQTEVDRLALGEDALVERVLDEAPAPGQRADHVDLAVLEAPAHEVGEDVAARVDGRIGPFGAVRLAQPPCRAVHDAKVVGQRRELGHLRFELVWQVVVV